MNFRSSDLIGIQFPPPLPKIIDNLLIIYTKMPQRGLCFVGFKNAVYERQVGGMWRRWLWFSRELLWLKVQLKLRWYLDTPLGLMGILVLFLGLSLLVTLGQALTVIFRSAIPWVSGSHVASVYWQSVVFSIKASVLFILFTISLIIFLVLKLNQR